VNATFTVQISHCWTSTVTHRPRASASLYCGTRPFGSTFNASPEPVKKGKKITLTATLKQSAASRRQLILDAQTVTLSRPDRAAQEATTGSCEYVFTDRSAVRFPMSSGIAEGSLPAPP
jgi:hypothetical protein